MSEHRQKRRRGEESSDRTFFPSAFFTTSWASSISSPSFSPAFGCFRAVYARRTVEWGKGHREGE